MPETKMPKHIQDGARRLIEAVGIEGMRELLKPWWPPEPDNDGQEESDDA